MLERNSLRCYNECPHQMQDRELRVNSDSFISARRDFVYLVPITRCSGELPFNTFIFQRGTPYIGPSIAFKFLSYSLKTFNHAFLWVKANGHLLIFIILASSIWHDHTLFQTLYLVRHCLTAELSSLGLLISLCSFPLISITDHLVPQPSS